MIDIQYRDTGWQLAWFYLELHKHEGRIISRQEPWLNPRVRSIQYHRQVIRSVTCSSSAVYRHLGTGHPPSFDVISARGRGQGVNGEIAEQGSLYPWNLSCRACLAMTERRRELMIHLNGHLTS